MKKLLFILALCLSVFATAQCPVGNLTQNAKWRFVFTQCMEDTLVIKYADTSKIAFIDSDGNLTTITYAALLDSLNVPDPTYPDSSVLFVGSDGKPTTDSANFVWDNDNNALRIGTPNPTFISGSLVSTKLLTSSTTQAQSTFLNYLATNSTTGASNYPLLQFMRTRGTVATPTTLSATDQNRNFGGVSFGSYDGTNFINNSAQIRVGSPRNWAVGQTPSYFEFWTTPSNSTIAGRSVFFTHTGGVAIGSNWADTTFNLTVNGTAAITQTDRSYDLGDTLLIKNDTNGAVNKWLPARRIALKNDSNSFGELNIKGSNALSTSFGIYTQSSAGTRLFTVANNGVHNYGTQTIEVFPSLNGSAVNTSGRGLVFSTAVTSQDAPAFTFIGNNLNTAAGSQYGLGLNMAFSPSSGTRVFNQFYITGVINQTGGANGIVRGIYVAPTLTAAADYRAIETTDGKVILGGTGVNSYLRVHVLTTAQRDALTGLTGGEIIFNSSTSKHQGYNGATWNDLY